MTDTAISSYLSVLVIVEPVLMHENKPCITLALMPLKDWKGINLWLNATYPVKIQRRPHPFTV